MSQGTIELVTLDTNGILDYLCSRDRRPIIQGLIDLATGATPRIDLAVTGYIHDDVPNDPLASRLLELPLLSISTTGIAFTLDRSVLGEPDRLGFQNFMDSYPESVNRAKEELRKRRISEGTKLRGKPPSQTDWNHLHAHLLNGRDVFLTSDEGIRCLEADLAQRFGIRVLRPEEYIEVLAAALGGYDHASSESANLHRSARLDPCSDHGAGRDPIRCLARRRAL